MSQSHQSKRWFITVNNYTEKDLDQIKELDYKYAVVSSEIAPTTGTPHFHALVIFATNKRFNALKRVITRGDIEVVKGTFQQAYEYTTKDGNILFEDGKKPGVSQLDCTFKAMIQEAKKGTVDKECLMYCRYEKYFQRFEPKEMNTFNGDLKSKNAWIFGPPGTGKSKLVRDYAEARGLRVYEKLANKWWDNYDGEEIVLMEDLDPKVCEALIHHIKLWADRYPFRAEIKGGSTRIVPKFQLIITSNYQLAACFPQGPDLSALRRRFDTWEMD